MNKFVAGTIIASVLVIIFVILVLRSAPTSSNSKPVATITPAPGEKVDAKTPVYKGDQTKIELYQDNVKIKEFSVDDLNIFQAPVPTSLSEREARPLKGHTVVLVSDLISGLDVKPNNTVRISSYNNDVVEYPAKDIFSKKNQLILVSTNEPAWKLADFSNPETLGGRERSGQSGFLQRNVRSVTILTSSSSAGLGN